MRWERMDLRSVVQLYGGAILGGIADECPVGPGGAHRNGGALEPAAQKLVCTLDEP